jgi:hypothetical protein
MATRIARSLLPLLLLSVSPMAGRQGVVRVPPLAQCRADADAWGIPGAMPPGVWDSPDDEFNNFRSKMDVQTPTTTVLNARNDELMECVNTDRLYSSRYTLASLVYKIAMLEREGHFLDRHGLVSQFYQEDDQGKR